MHYLNLEDVLLIHRRQVEFAGGDPTIRDMSGLQSAVAQPRMSFGGEFLYPTLAEQAAALGFSLIKNHPFLDANKRTGQMAMELFLWLNGFELGGTEEDQYDIIFGVASGTVGREKLASWIRDHLVPTHF